AQTGTISVSINGQQELTEHKTGMQKLAGAVFTFYRTLFFIEPFIGVTMSTASITSTAQGSATVLDGKALAKQIEQQLSARVEAIKAKTGLTPSLARILVGDDPASATYVRMKGNACKRVGMDSIRVEMPSATTTAELIAKIDELNSNPDVHGI